MNLISIQSFLRPYNIHSVNVMSEKKRCIQSYSLPHMNVMSKRSYPHTYNLHNINVMPHEI